MHVQSSQQLGKTELLQLLKTGALPVQARIQDFEMGGEFW